MGIETTLTRKPVKKVTSPCLYESIEKGFIVYMYEDTRGVVLAKGVSGKPNGYQSSLWNLAELKLLEGRLTMENM
jgi:hypothetical protein